ncbi:MAG: LysE family translocator [Gammaproteobacteria bacterium]
MEAGIYFAFIVISIAVLVFPGPSILLIVANGLQRGVIVGMYTVAGGIVAMLVQLLVAIAGLTSVETIFDGSFAYVRWIGVAYLLYLGIQRWRGHALSELRGGSIRTYRSAVIDGFIVALTNPGTMLFFVAFFPQFLNEALPTSPQLVLMAGTFMVLTTLVDISYAVLSGRIGQRLHKPGPSRMRNRLAGAILVAAAIALALVNF